jgi:hypothetical protein
MGDHVMEMGYIAEQWTQPQQGIASCSIAELGGDTADNLNSISFHGVDDRGSARGIRIHLICRRQED